MKFQFGRLGVDVKLYWDDTVDNNIIAPPPVIEPTKPPILVTPVKPEPEILTQPEVHTPDNPVNLSIYKVTSAFEGGPVGKINFTNLTGNFDGQGLSIGFLQWCVGQGSDLPLFNMMLEKYPAVMKKALGKFYDELVSYLSKPTATRLAWAIKSVNHNNKVDEAWRVVLTNLCNTEEFQQIQLLFADRILNRAKSMCEEYGIKSVRALMLMFDICTQNGSIKAETKTNILAAKTIKEKALGRPLKELELLELIAIKRSEAADPKWVTDVKSRKLTIVYGTGVVHGDKYALSTLGITDQPFK